MEECVRSEPPRILAYQELNASFHDVPTDAAGHKRLKQMMQTLHNQIRYFSYQTLSDRDHIESSCRYHRKICEAFKGGDQEETIRLSREHVLAALNYFTRKFVHASHAPAYDTSRSPVLENADA
jgi:DNA-binding GntR family transcriptional regulator